MYYKQWCITGNVINGKAKKGMKKTFPLTKLQCFLVVALFIFILNILSMSSQLYTFESDRTTTSSSKVSVSNKSENPRVPNQKDEQDSNFYWIKADESGYFKSIDTLHWIEFSEGKEFKFEQTKFNKQKREIIIEDKTRNIEIKLSPSNAQIKLNSPSFRHLYSGYFKTFQGQNYLRDLSKKEQEFFHLFENEQNLKPAKPKIISKRVHVFLASYRDKLCSNTLKEIFENTKNPDNIFIYIADQKTDEDISCVDEYCDQVKNCRRSQITTIDIPISKARGVMPARYHQLRALKSEHSDDFCLQIDSHSAFENKWDEMAIEEFLVTENEFAVLSAYPNRVKDKHKQNLAPARCSTKLSNHKVNGKELVVVNGGNSAHNIKHGKKPTFVPFFGAGVAFSKCHANLNVPYDPYMSYLFGGEEFNRAARLFTWGYDLYAPRKNFVFHYYDDDIKEIKQEKKTNLKRDRSFFTDKEGLGQQTTLRWRNVFGLGNKGEIAKSLMNIDLSLFGFGVKRELKTFLQFSGVDFDAEVVEDRCPYLKRMEWIPYKRSSIENKVEEAGLRICSSLNLSKVNAEEFLNIENNEVSRMMKKAKKQEINQNVQISQVAVGLKNVTLEIEEFIKKNEEELNLNKRGKLIVVNEKINGKVTELCEKLRNEIYLKKL
eukprot:maker-scaffold_6-snap-gene-1.43-mRNA-1 protein AED:0.01 eAED:0.01 QI:0/1/0.5/1/1/1/2/30/659